jgi:hypothetical protein
MNIVKALVGGLVGGGLGAVASNYAQPLFKEPNPWTLILAGLFAGLGVRVLCGRNRDFLTGVLATVAAILAIGGASYWVSLSTIRAMYSKEAIANVLAALLAFVLGTGSPATVGDESQDATGDVDEHA